MIGANNYWSYKNTFFWNLLKHGNKFEINATLPIATFHILYTNKFLQWMNELILYRESTTISLRCNPDAGITYESIVYELYRLYIRRQFIVALITHVQPTVVHYGLDRENWSMQASHRLDHARHEKAEHKQILICQICFNWEK